jgi:DedD protein
MNSLFDEDDSIEPRQDADLTLGIGSLLSIFFGVVIICGIFFAFGYTMGRRNAHAAAPAETTPAPAAASSLPENALSAPIKPPDDNADDLSDDNNKSPAAPSPAPATSAPSASADKEARTPPPAKAPAKPAQPAETASSTPSLNAVPYSHRATLPAKPHAGISAPLEQAPTDAPIIPGHPIMVQIAAISRQEDAEVLAGALRKRGFNPSVHPGGGDKLYHVQVGPFTDKAQAEAMKQRLLADGYNAIMK